MGLSYEQLCQRMVELALKKKRFETPANHCRGRRKPWLICGLSVNNKNRRMGRGHVLDVKMRSDSGARATRMRLATAAFALIFGTVFGLYLFWRAGEWTLDKFIYENSEFAIQQIDVQSDGKNSRMNKFAAGQLSSVAKI